MRNFIERDPSGINLASSGINLASSGIIPFQPEPFQTSGINPESFPFRRRGVSPPVDNRTGDLTVRRSPYAFRAKPLTRQHKK